MNSVKRKICRVEFSAIADIQPERDAAGYIVEENFQLGPDVRHNKYSNLHRKVAGHPGAPNRMPVCCSIMRRMMTPGDIQIQAPPKGDGGNLVIEYRLPRQ